MGRRVQRFADAQWPFPIPKPVHSFFAETVLRYPTLTAVMKTILVIEDEAKTRDIFLRCLTFEGFCAVGAESGYGVLAALHHEPATSAIPFIFLTAKVTLAGLCQGMELGADDYLTKPCTVEQFLSAISTRLKRQNMLKHWYTETSQQSDLAAVSSTAVTPLHPKTIFPSCPKLNQVFQFIEAHYNRLVSLSDVAQAVGYSPAYLTSLVQAQTGRTVKRWITERRMAQARMLLTTIAQPVNQVAEVIGYADANYLICQFRQLHAISPQAWRNAAQTQVSVG